ncbi:MAG: dephospho-CoA kinase [Eubacteriales bacterium]|nr:dephospho-CoA kinase [Eubacteriales bacterium]
MICFVITGGIASGKSNVLKCFAKQGIDTFSADTIGHDIANTKEAQIQIEQAFGSGYYVDGVLQRKALGQLVFSNPSHLQSLNSIMHGLIYAEIQRIIQASQSKPAIAIEIPLLFETNMQHIADVIVHCYTSSKTQLARVMKRDGLSLAQAQQRIQAQMPTEQKMSLSHYNINTECSFAETEQSVKQILQKYEVLYASRAKTPASKSAPHRANSQ